MLSDLKITFCEIGARGNVRNFFWLEPYIDYIGFEPDQTAFESKNIYLKQRKFRSINLFPDAVGINDEFERKKLFITEHPGCSSTYEPNFEMVNEFSGFKANDETRKFNESFKIKQSVTIGSNSLNNFLQSLPVENFDIIQIDTQGGELEIIEAFRSLDKVVCIDIELEFLEIYKGQSLFIDAFNSLTERGFILARVFNSQYAPSLALDRFNQVDLGLLFSSDCIFLRLPKKGEEFTEENIDMTKKFISIAYIYGFYSLAIKYCDLGVRCSDCSGDHDFFNFMREQILKDYKARNFWPKIRRFIHQLLLKIGRKFAYFKT